MGEESEDYDYEEDVLSILRGGEGCCEQYSSVCEFKHHLNEDGFIEEKTKFGWIFGRDGQQFDLYANNIHENIASLLKHIPSYPWSEPYIIQFWEAVEMEGGHRYLSTSNQPFYVSRLTKGACWYRKISRGSVYGVDAEAEADAEQLGGVGRAYRSKQLETSPDLRLYTTSEFPLRDNAARCGFRTYMALPLVNFRHQNPNQCIGVLEILSISPMIGFGGILDALDEGLWIAGFRSTHIPLYRNLTNMNKQHQVDGEITEILELSIRAIPQLSLAVVWVPCRHCQNSRCLEISSFEYPGSRKKPNYELKSEDVRIYRYIEACTFHNLQFDVSRLGQVFCDDSISKNSLSHYAERAMLPQVFAIYLQSVNNNNRSHFYVMEFFFQPKYGDGDSSLHLLFKILHTKLKSFKIMLGGRFMEEFSVQSRQPPNAFELESMDMLKAMDSWMDPCMKKLSEPNFTKFFGRDEICCFRPSSNHSNENSIRGWVFCSPIGEESYKNDVSNHSLRVPEIFIKEKILHFMRKMASDFVRTYYMVQFWAPGMIENRRCLKTLDQPYVVDCLTKGAALFRNKCIKHYYFVDEEAKEDELGPVGRVFKNGYPEPVYDIFSYSTKEFSMRNYAIHCGFERYFALPVFDEQQVFNKHKCVGVLEFIGFEWSPWYALQKDLEDIRTTLKGANLYWNTHSHHDLNVYNKEAKDEINNALSLISEIPECYKANAWVQNGKCMSTNSKCMEWLEGTDGPPNDPRLILVEPRIGMIGVVVESESKSCLFPNVCQLWQFQSYSERKFRRSACFAICLQSSHTGDLLYVLEFFLQRVPTTLEYLMSFFNFLLPVLKHELKSFKLATGKQLGEEELVVEVIEFSETNQLSSSYPHQLKGFRVQFKSVLYSQKEPEHTEVGQRKRGNRDLASNVEITEKENRKRELVSQRKAENATELLPLTLDNLKPYMGMMNLEDVATVFKVGRSTFKRFCRGHGIRKWPRIKNQARNSTFFEGESSHQVPMQPSSSNSHQVLDTSIQQNINTQHNLFVADEQEKVMVKVKHERDVIKFESCLQLGVVKLREEVGKRLELEMGSFKLKYMDEDNEEILIACDEDLQLCPKTRASTGKTCIQLFVPK